MLLYALSDFFDLYRLASRRMGRGKFSPSGFPVLLFAAGGNLAVCIFLALSGFVLARSSKRSELPVGQALQSAADALATTLLSRRGRLLTIPQLGINYRQTCA